MILGKRKTMFDIIKEAEDDENASGSESGTTEDSATEDATSNDSDTEESTDEGGEDTSGDDEDFSIDTNLDDDISDEDMGGEDSSDSGSSDLDSGSSDGPEEDTSEEAVENNSDIFASLTVEEQKIKISELKSCYADLYNSLSDLLDKANMIDPDENIEVLNRLTGSMYKLKNYLKDYILKIFPNKSYIENDIAFNRFLSMMNSFKTVIDELSIIRDQKYGIKRDEDDKK